MSQLQSAMFYHHLLFPFRHDFILLQRIDSILCIFYSSPVIFEQTKPPEF